MQSIRHLLRGSLLELKRRMSASIRLIGIERTTPILIYQMGKVGSSTVTRTLRQMGVPDPVEQIHTLRPDQLKKAVVRQRASPARFLPEHLLVSKGLIRKLSGHVFPCKVITLTREPISRAISMVFEDWQKKAPDAMTPEGSLEPLEIQRAITDMLRKRDGNADPTQWFDRELRHVFGVDVFAEPFDFDRGYSILSTGSVSVLILRMEDIDGTLQTALTRFLNVDSSAVELRDANVGADKWYSDTIKEVKKNYSLPSDVADFMLNTRYVRHFYSREVDDLRALWTDSKQSDG